jgi:uncharacterized membrane protein
MFAGIAVNPVLRIPVWAVATVPMAIVIPGTIVLIRQCMKPGEPLEAMPNECWKAGAFYYNPADAALFVQERFGVGYTFNFANPWCWTLMGGLGLVLIAGFCLLA